MAVVTCLQLWSLAVSTAHVVAQNISKVIVHIKKRRKIGSKKVADFLWNTEGCILNDVLVALFHEITLKIFKLQKVHKNTINIS